VEVREADIYGAGTPHPEINKCDFPYFSRTTLLLLPDFSRHFVHLYLNKNITELAFKY